MSEHSQYWRNRKAGKRGQSSRRGIKYYAKGEKLKHTKWDGTEVDYPNDEGSHGIINTKGQLVKLNRKQYRQRSPFRATAKGYKGHTVNPPKYEDDISPNLTNHERHLQRRKRRAITI